jgi:hypothetical protein
MYLKFLNRGGVDGVGIKGVRSTCRILIGNIQELRLLGIKEESRLKR